MHSKAEYLVVDEMTGHVRYAESSAEFVNNKWTVKKDVVNNLVISTVFLGVNHGEVDKPLFFETVVYDLIEDFSPCPTYLIQRRYATKLEAFSNHNEIVEMARCFLQGQPIN